MELRRSRRLAGLCPQEQIEQKGGFSDVAMKVEEDAGGSVIPTVVGLLLVASMYIWALAP
jgi:hypothetical protein